MHKLSLQRILLFSLTLAFLALLDTKSVFAQPVITNTEIRNIGYTSVTIAWRTDVPTNSQISYGESSADALKSPASIEYNTYHAITVTKLRPATTYLFKVTSTTESGESVTSDVQRFSTLSFTFEDDLGTFGQLTMTPTPTPYVNPYAQTYPQNTYTQQTPPYYQPVYQQPLYIVPPVVYQQQTGNTLGEATTQHTVVTPTPIPAALTMLQSSIWGIVILLGILLVLFVLLLHQMMKNKKDLQQLEKQLLMTKANSNDVRIQAEPEKKVYRFDVRS